MRKEKQTHVRVFKSDKILFKNMRDLFRKKSGRKLGEAEGFRKLIRKARRKKK